MIGQRAAQQKKQSDTMGAIFRSSPSKDLSCHFDPSPLGRGLHHHVEVAGRWCRNSAHRPRIREQKLFFRNFCGLAPDFVKLRVYFGTETFFLCFTFFV